MMVILAIITLRLLWENIVLIERIGNYTGVAILLALLKRCNI